jgi:predicted DNA-binding protein
VIYFLERYQCTLRDGDSQWTSEEIFRKYKGKYHYIVLIVIYFLGNSQCTLRDGDSQWTSEEDFMKYKGKYH